MRDFNRLSKEDKSFSIDEVYIKILHPIKITKEDKSFSIDEVYIKILHPIKRYKLKSRRENAF